MDSFVAKLQTHERIGQPIRDAHLLFFSFHPPILHALPIYTSQSWIITPPLIFIWTIVVFLLFFLISSSSSSKVVALLISSLALVLRTMWKRGSMLFYKNSHGVAFCEAGLFNVLYCPWEHSWVSAVYSYPFSWLNIEKGLGRILAKLNGCRRLEASITSSYSSQSSSSFGVLRTLQEQQMSSLHLLNSL